MKRLRIKKSLAFFNSGPKKCIPHPPEIEKTRKILYSVSSILVYSYRLGSLGKLRNSFGRMVILKK
jgi:hypothetical protein